MGCELTGRLEDKEAKLTDLGGLGILHFDEFLKNWEQVSRCFTRSRDRVRQDIITIQDSWDHLPLDDSRMLIVQLVSSLGQWLTYEQLVEGDKVLLVVVDFCVLLDDC